MGPVHVQGVEELLQLGPVLIMGGEPGDKLGDRAWDLFDQYADGVCKLGDDQQDDQRDGRDDQPDGTQDADGAAYSVERSAGFPEEGKPFDPCHQDVQDIGDGAADGQRFDDPGKISQCSHHRVAVFEKEDNQDQGQYAESQPFSIHKESFLSEFSSVKPSYHRFRAGNRAK